ncbi:hypothetical protein [Foetidibacter luteolus]|uniref:hypothetical protein n=1 Tax=Foetidibacter luteolus TaxID=2608880 RepID=UPI00129B9375|nr:hypothetical protein [Foetidibacter luteolus]
MRRLTKTAVISALFLSFILMFSCSKDDGPALASRQYVLFNQSSGTPMPAGVFTVQQLSDGNAAINIQLSNSYLVPGVTLNAYMTIADSSNLIYATLGTVDGATGQGSINPVKTDGNNQPVKYEELIGKTGYTVRVLNNSNLQASGSIE